VGEKLCRGTAPCVGPRAGPAQSEESKRAVLRSARLRLEQPIAGSPQPCFALVLEPFWQIVSDRPRAHCGRCKVAVRLWRTRIRRRPTTVGELARCDELRISTRRRIRADPCNAGYSQRPSLEEHVDKVVSLNRCIWILQVRKTCRLHVSCDLFI